MSIGKHIFRPVNHNVNLIDIEKRQLLRWEKQGIVRSYLHKNDNAKQRYSFLDGPITANNPMAVHHAWGRTYKDIWQRYFTMRGYVQRYQNGFDCQGLWVEVEVEKDLKLKSKKDIEKLVPGDRIASISQFVDLCKERVMKYSDMQTAQSKRLGYFMDWDHSYYTMSDENNYMIWHALKVCHEKGWIKKSRDVVPWCPRCETAISQHEILTEDYKEVTHDSIYLEFPVSGKKKEALLVWTTTPWTIPANVAVAVDRSIDYSLVEGTTGINFWIASERVNAVFGKGYPKIIKRVKGKELEGIKYETPFDSLTAVKRAEKENPELFHTVVLTDPLLMPISIEEGTGLVHAATGTGEEDGRLGKKLGLPIISAIDDVADYLPGFDEFTGKNAKKHPEIILDYLKMVEKKDPRWIFNIVPFTHRYPVCWRCKTELVWKVAEEWYIAMDTVEKGGSKTLRELMEETAKQIDWHPSFGLERELDWLSNMHDWLISKKNRYWGLALPIYECRCGEITVVGSKEELKSRAISGWESLEGHGPHKPYIDNVMIACPKCREKVKRIGDVGNVWLDAGIVAFSTLIDPNTQKVSYTSDQKYWRKWYPADFITESFPGQFKNWFYSLIAMATILEKKTSFTTILGYASMLAEDGKPMHKSLGNAIEFNEAADTLGADVMRFMFALQDPQENMLFGRKKADETRRQFHLILWNIYNFFITYALADGFVPSQKFKPSENILDQWILSRLDSTIEACTQGLDQYKADSSAFALFACVSDCSLWYVRRSRDRIGPSSDNHEDKNACYQTLFTVLTTLCRLLAPFVPFLTDEIYTNLTGEISVHLTKWPRKSGLKSDILEKNMLEVRHIVESIHAERKKLGIPVRQPLESATVYRTGNKLPTPFMQLIREEVNIKLLNWGKAEKVIRVELDTKITPQLKQEGDAREIIRSVQGLRRKMSCTMTERIRITLPEIYKNMPENILAHIQKKTLADTIIWGEAIDIQTLRQ